MSESKRKFAAAKFRRHIGRSNELHAQYLGDPDFLDTFDRFCRLQLAYLLPHFSDLYAVEGYGDAIDFIMSDLSGVGISERDHDLERAAPVIAATLPLAALNTLASAADLNARVLEINLGICRNLLVDGSLPARITVRDYFVACRAASTYDECAHLVYLTTDLGATLESLVKVPLIGLTLRAMKTPARAAGFGALHEFLQTGFSTFRQIPDVEHFLQQIRVRMTDLFAWVYTSPLSEADISNPVETARQASKNRASL